MEPEIKFEVPGVTFTHFSVILSVGIFRLAGRNVHATLYHSSLLVTPAAVFCSKCQLLDIHLSHLSHIITGMRTQTQVFSHKCFGPTTMTFADLTRMCASRSSNTCQDFVAESGRPFGTMEWLEKIYTILGRTWNTEPVGRIVERSIPNLPSGILWTFGQFLELIWITNMVNSQSRINI